MLSHQCRAITDADAGGPEEDYQCIGRMTFSRSCLMVLL